jgi:hypothetical protein
MASNTRSKGKETAGDDASLKDASLKDALLKDASLKDALLKDASLKDALQIAVRIKSKKFEEEMEGKFSAKDVNDDAYLPKAHYRELYQKFNAFSANIYAMETSIDACTRECAVCYKKLEIARITWEEARVVACCERVCIDCIHRVYNRYNVFALKCPYCQV